MATPVVFLLLFFLKNFSAEASVEGNSRHGPPSPDLTTFSVDQGHFCRVFCICVNIKLYKAPKWPQ